MFISYCEYNKVYRKLLEVNLKILRYAWIENLISAFSYLQSLALWTSVDKITCFQIIMWG